jgi:hypothetical protein
MIEVTREIPLLQSLVSIYTHTLTRTMPLISQKSKMTYEQAITMLVTVSGSESW